MVNTLSSAPVKDSQPNNQYDVSVSKDALQGYVGTGLSWQIFQTQLDAAIPNAANLASIGSETPGIPGPNSLGTMNSPAGVENSSLKNTTLCAQNLNNLGPGNFGTLASTLLPNPNTKFEGQEDCKIADNELANQVFLSAVGQIGFNTNPGTVRNLDLRSVPPCPILNVSPWGNSSTYPDLMRRPLEGTFPTEGIYAVNTKTSKISTD